VKLFSYARSAIEQAGAVMRAAPLLPVVAVAAVALGIVLVGTVHVAARNLHDVLANWGQGVQLTVYFQPEASVGRAAAVAEALRRVPGIEHVRYITAAEAMERLKSGLGPSSPLLDGVDDDFLPPSLEVSFARGHDDVATLAAVAERVGRMPGVDQVETSGDWVKRLAAAADLARAAAWVAFALVGTACLYLAFATIRLAVFARREEIEILKLVGATDRYVRAPFWIEGLLEGLLGGGLGALSLYLLFRAAAPRVEALLGGLLGGIHLGFPPGAHIAAGVAVAALTGLLGAHLAVRRHLHV